MPAVDALPWEQAWREALYGAHGFYRRPEGPAGHFRTSSHVPLFAEALARVAADLDASLGEPDGFTVVDVGAGRGELIDRLAELAPERWRLLGVDVVDRPAGLSARVEWSTSPPESVTGLLMAHELLDVVPCPVVEVDDRGTPRLVLVDAAGVEALGPRVEHADAAWLERWWPVQEPGERAEVGAPRDRLWADLVGRLERGGALAVDYSHSSDDRGSGRWARGSLVGHLRGRVVAPVPDGSCDLTARVALDACALATATAVDLTLHSSQREALLALGVSATVPDPAGAADAPQTYVEALQRAGQARELTDPDGFGDFGWLLQLRGVSPVARAPA